MRRINFCKWCQKSIIIFFCIFYIQRDMERIKNVLSFIYLLLINRLLVLLKQFIAHFFFQKIYIRKKIKTFNKVLILVINNEDICFCSYIHNIYNYHCSYTYQNYYKLFKFYLYFINENKKIFAFFAYSKGKFTL